MEFTPEQQQIIEKKKLAIQIADRLRLVFLFLALFVVLFLFFGMKFWDGKPWFDQITAKLYDFLFYDIIFMFIAIIAKVIFTFRHNQYVKKC